MNNDHIAIGTTFVLNLRAELGEAVFAEVKELNATPAYVDSCASHDFCDPNLLMAAAFETVMGRHIDLRSDANVALWNKAWEWAKLNRLTEAAQ